MKEAFAGVLAGLQGLGANDSHERPIDRLAALGVIGRGLEAVEHPRTKNAQREAALCSLGVDLIAFKFGNRAPSKALAEEKLADAMAWPSWKMKLTAKQRAKIAAWAVQEWAIDLCPLCKGAKEIPAERQGREGVQRMKPCPQMPIGCGATGKRRYSDSERADALDGRFDKAMAVAHGIIGRAEALAVEHGKRMLERW